MKKKETVYCLAKCANQKCEQHGKFRPVHGDNAQADFSDRCDGYKKSS